MRLSVSLRCWLVGGLLIAVAAGLGQIGARAGSEFDDEAPKMTPPRKDVKPFEYIEAKVPYYPPGEKWGTIGKPIGGVEVKIAPDGEILTQQRGQCGDADPGGRPAEQLPPRQQCVMFVEGEHGSTLTSTTNN